MDTPQTWVDLGIDAPPSGTGEYRTICPRCTPHRKPANQRRKDLSCNLDDGTWFCHHCQWSGGLGSSRETWQDRLSVQVPAKPMPKTYEPPRPLPAVSMPTVWDNLVTWFAERGIPESVMVEKSITAATEFCPVCQESVGNVLFPYYVDGEHINTKHRCGKKHFRMERGARRVLYNVDACAFSDTLVIVEGEMDALSVHTAGIPHVVSVPDGAPAPNASSYSSKFLFLEAHEELFERVKRVVIATDADEPGQKLMEELARRIGPEKCSRVIWDEGIKDANEYLIAHGPEALRTRIESATPYPVEGIFTGRELLAEHRDLLQELQRGVGLAHSGEQLIGTQFQQGLPGGYRITFIDKNLAHHTGNFGTNTGRGHRHYPAGSNHLLHQGRLGDRVGGHLRTRQVTRRPPGQQPQQQHR